MKKIDFYRNARIAVRSRDIRSFPAAILVGIHRNMVANAIKFN